MQPPSRRTFLALGLLLSTGGALAACTGSHHGEDGGGPGERRRPDPDEPVRQRAVSATDALLAGYDALLAGSGAGQAGLLEPLRAEVVQHRAALAAGLPGPSAAPSGAASGTASGSGSGTASGSAPQSPSGSPGSTAPASTVTTTAALASLERQTAQTRLADLGAASPQLARLLASVSAAGVLHTVALGDTAPAAAAPPGPTDPATAPVPPSSGAAPSGPASGSPSAAPSGSTAGTGPEALTALQGALGAEHAAIYGYGVVGARLPDDQQRADARTALAAHQTRRDAWQRLLGGAGASPSAAAAGYQLPFAVTDAAGATRLAAHLESRLTAVYADLVAAVTGPQRATAADALRECALRARRWGAAPTAFPGLPDPAGATPATTPATTGGATGTPAG
ncbi:ferritin-like domain-containing protein [Kitasatospora sp. NPDC091207]|uniref:ferritin-like domain-containing protein n=1 Tax=Kitasatospora sp. NPDC091207 TaxID=3364083 RepID=UPI0038042CC8